MELGAEKLIARYIGSAEHIAYNEGVLRDSLASLEGRPLISGNLNPVQGLQWTPSAWRAAQKGIPIPVGWFTDQGAPSLCRGLPQTRAAVALYPGRDFTIALRAAVWNAENVALEDAAVACSPRRGTAGAASYAVRTEWLGVSYSIEGTFVRLGGQLVQLEVITPDQKSAYGRALLSAWIKATGPDPSQ
jgi:hypothetical protein